MSEQTDESRVLALALCEIRNLLSSNLGSENRASIEVRVAAHLAYALHNEALAMLEGRSFNVQAALGKIGAIDEILNVKFGEALVRNLTNSKRPNA